MIITLDELLQNRHVQLAVPARSNNDAKLLEAKACKAA